MISKRTPLLVVSGPTASGKTAAAIALALELNGEIISCDSVQIYKGCVIGSNAPSTEELASVPHHGIGVLEPNEVAHAGWFVRFALERIEDIVSRGKLPVLCGGTTMWLTSLLSGLKKLPPRNEELRAQMATKSAQELHEMLQKVDPQKALKLHPHDRIRVERALEIQESSALFDSQVEEEIKFPGNALVVIQSMPREVLYERINARTLEMFRAGFIKEVDELLHQYSDTAPALMSIGYSSIVHWIRQGRIDVQKDALIAEVAQATRNYAKRQLTFFRNEPVKRGWRILPDTIKGSRAERCRSLLDRWAKGEELNHRYYLP